MEKKPARRYEDTEFIKKQKKVGGYSFNTLPPAFFPVGSVSLCLCVWFFSIIFITLFGSCQDINPRPDITYTVAQVGGEENTTDTTGILFSFSEPVNRKGLTAAHVHITGPAVRGAAQFTRVGADWLLSPIIIREADEIEITIKKEGIESQPKTLAVFKEPGPPPIITYTIEQSGVISNNTAGILFTFAVNIDSIGVGAADISVNGNASKGFALFTKQDDTSWLLAPITINTAGTIFLSIDKTGIEKGMKSVTVYKEPPSDHWNVSWVLNGGSWGEGSLHPPSVDKGQALARPAPDPSKSGYAFGGWYSNAALTALYNFNNIVADNITLYARWLDDDEAKFGEGSTIDRTFTVSNTAEWNTMASAISAGGSGKNYMVNITGSFPIAGTTTGTFGYASNIKVSIQGKDGDRAISLSNSGSALRITNTQTVILENIAFTGMAANTAAIMYVDEGTLDIRSGTKITGNTVVGGSRYGGGVFVYGTLRMGGGEISGNEAESGGGVYVWGSGTFIMDGGEISGNAGIYGGGAYVHTNGAFTMNGGKISGHTIPALGAGVYVNTNGSFAMHGGEISGNTSGGPGGGVAVYGTFAMHGGEISGNTTSGGGAGVYVYDNGTITMNEGEISGNRTSGPGGGVYVHNTSTFTMHSGTISGNESSNPGGGVYTQGDFIMHDGEISDNTCNSVGGGVYVSNFTMHGGTISGNTNTTSNPGGGVYVNNIFTMNGGELSGNKITGTGTSALGGGAYTTTLHISNGVIYGSNAAAELKNTASSGAAIYVNTTAERGTLTGGTWNKSADISKIHENTLRVVNGSLQ